MNAIAPAPAEPGDFGAHEAQLRRIRTDLHDRVQQPLGALLLELDHIATQTDAASTPTEALLSRSREVLRHALAGVDVAVSQLRPWALDLLDLDAALQQLAARLQQSCGLQVELEWASPEIASALEPGPLTDRIYRLVEHCLTEAHARQRAGFAHVLIDAAAPGQLTLQIRHDGAGPDSSPDRNTG